MNIIPASKYVIGQPVIASWDCKGATLGAIYAKVWCPRPLAPYNGFWRYWVRRVGKDTYAEMEEQLEPAILTKAALLARTKLVVNNERQSA